jgi:hypothetical protein
MIFLSCIYITQMFFRERRYLNLVLRLLALGIIVFVSASVVPTQPLDFQVKLLITILVVVIYSLMDFITITMILAKDQVCNLIC